MSCEISILVYYFVVRLKTAQQLSLFLWSVQYFLWVLFLFQGYGCVNFSHVYYAPPYINPRTCIFRILLLVAAVLSRLGRQLELSSWCVFAKWLGRALSRIKIVLKNNSLSSRLIKFTIYLHGQRVLLRVHSIRVKGGYIMKFEENLPTAFLFVFLLLLNLDYFRIICSLAFLPTKSLSQRVRRYFNCGNSGSSTSQWWYEQGERTEEVNILISPSSPSLPRFVMPPYPFQHPPLWPLPEHLTHIGCARRVYHR